MADGPGGAGAPDIHDTVVNERTPHSRSDGGCEHSGESGPRPSLRFRESGGMHIVQGNNGYTQRLG